MKLLIVGSRGIDDFDLSPYVTAEVDFIISGGAAGVDTIAERYADKNGISKLILKPNYKLYGRCAPLKRNEKMVDVADRVLVIWDGKSKGSLYTIRYAEKIGKDLAVVDLSADPLTDNG